MRLRPKKLRVYPNPWGVAPFSLGKPIDPGSVTIDHEGRPCGVCAADKHEHIRTPGAAVGSMVCPDRTVVTQDLAKGDDLRSAMQTTVRRYFGSDLDKFVGAEDPELGTKLAALEPAEIPCTGYYIEQLAAGSLIAADADTAAVARVSFMPPRDLIPKLESAAIEAFNEHFDGVDGGAFAMFAKQRALAAHPAQPASTRAAPAVSDEVVQ